MSVEFENRKFTKQQANHYVGLMWAYMLHDYATDKGVHKQGDKTIFPPFLTAENVLNGMKTKIENNNSASIAYKLVKDLTNEEYKKGFDGCKGVMAMVEGATNYPIPETKQGMLNQIALKALAAGVLVNPILGEKVTVKSVSSIVTGAITSLKNGVKNFLENSVGISFGK